MTDELDALAARQTMLVEKVMHAVKESLEAQRGGYYVDIDAENDCASLDGNFALSPVVRAAIEAVLDAVASELRAVQYDPAPYTAMKVRLAAMRKEALP